MGFSANVSDEGLRAGGCVVSGFWRLQGWLPDSEVAWMLRGWGMGNKVKFLVFHWTQCLIAAVEVFSHLAKPAHILSEASGHTASGLFFRLPPS